MKTAPQIRESATLEWSTRVQCDTGFQPVKPESTAKMAVSPSCNGVLPNGFARQCLANSADGVPTIDMACGLRVDFAQSIAPHWISSARRTSGGVIFFVGPASPQLRVSPEKLLQSLSYRHTERIVEFDDNLKHAFYETESMRDNWSVRELKWQTTPIAGRKNVVDRDIFRASVGLAHPPSLWPSHAQMWRVFLFPVFPVGGGG
ncbi:MAG: hypothetical protein HY360_03450 [Verrucomicrobia bacterium]|nr:hypothetical protein [Verrucomicrobiota bacterium]